MTEIDVFLQFNFISPVKKLKKCCNLKINESRIT